MGRTPRTASQHGGASARGRAGAPKKEAAGKKEPPIHERLYVAHTAAYGQSLKPAETSDPECTFRPNLGSPEAAHPSRSQAGESAAAGAPPPRTRAQLEEVGEALYRDAHNRRIRRQMVEAQLSSELEQARSRRDTSPYPASSPPPDPASLPGAHEQQDLVALRGDGLLQAAARRRRHLRAGEA